MIRTYTFSVGSVGGTNPTPVPTQPPTPTQAPQPTAEFNRDPGTVNMRSDGAWHSFKMDLNEEIKVVVNPSGSQLILKIAETNTNNAPPDNWCDISAPKKKSKNLEDNDRFYISACADGIATIELWSTSTSTPMKVYAFRVGSGPQPTATPTSTPVPTPAPTATPEPVCQSGSSSGSAVGLNTCSLPTPAPSCNVTDVGDLTSIGAGSTITQHDSWIGGCTTGSLHNEWYVRYYRFNLDKSTHVTLDVTNGGTAIIRKGRRTSGLTEYTSPATLEQTDEYTVAVSSHNTGSFTLKIKGRIPWLGHQQDNTVKYLMGSMPQARSSPQPTNPVPDPATFIPEAMDEAARQWNIAARSNPGLLVCKDDGSTNGCVFNGTDRITDNKDVLVNALPGDNVGFLHRRDPWEVFVLGSNHCGNTYACVKPRGVLSSLQFVTKLRWLPLVNDHLQDLTMVIEEPAWLYNDSTGRFTGRLWTDVDSRHLTAVNPSDRANIPGLEQAFAYTWIYAPGVIMHEFGHTAGLTDLYHLTGYSGYLMDTNYDETSIPSRDKAYIRQVYHNHNRH